MNKFKIIILLTLCLSLSAKAQEKYLLKIDKKDSDLRIKVPVRNYFYISKVIDGRIGDTSHIGFVYKRFSATLKQMETTFQDGLVPTFNSLIQIGELDIKSKDIQEPFVIVVKDLEISESIGQFKSSGRVELTVTFLKQKNDTLTSVFTAEVFEQAGMGSLNSNMVKIKKCLEKALVKFEDFLTDKNQSNFYSDVENESKEEAEKFGLTLQLYPQKDAADVSLKIPRKYGIYKSFNSFKKNQPEIIDNFTRENVGVEKSTLNIYSKTMKKLNGNYFCLFDRDNIYMSSKKFSGYRYFVKVSTIGNMIAWKDRTIKNQMKQANYSAIGAGLGGIAGAAAGATMASQVGLDCVALDIRTGRSVIMEPKELEILLKEDIELLKAYKSAPNPKDGEVLLYYIKEYNKKHPLL